MLNHPRLEIALLQAQLDERRRLAEQLQALAPVETFRKEGLGSLNDALAKRELPTVVSLTPRTP